MFNGPKILIFSKLNLTSKPEYESKDHISLALSFYNFRT